MNTLQSPQVIARTLGHDRPYEPVPGRWSAERANAWYDALPWLAGTNSYPATAITQIEMWPASTFDPATIEREMAWSAELGFNTQRVYLHDLVWGDDEQGLYQRMDQFLDICTGHGIRPFFVFFDDCHFPDPQLGEQPLPIPGYHNSGWVTSPARVTALRFADGSASPAERARLQGYVQGTMARFADDQRVLMWELHNEPGRGSRAAHDRQGDLEEGRPFADGSAPLVQAAWEWARAVAPSQPICSTTQGCEGDVNWSINYLNSDVHSIHSYGPAHEVANLITRFRADDRPIFMTEYLARENGSTFQDVMPVLKEHKVAAINWGLVAGKSGTIWNWQSRRRDGAFQSADDLRAAGKVAAPGEPLPEPDLWFHDVLRPDGTPYDEQEAAVIRRLTGRTAAGSETA
jgi:hypothetical protein